MEPVTRAGSLPLALDIRTTTTESKLLSLPNELQQRVVFFLDAKGIKNMRLVCKTICANANGSFDDLFSTRTVFMHPHSLQNLVDITGHDQLRRCVRQVNIDTSQIVAPSYNDHSEQADLVRPIYELQEATWLSDQCSTRLHTTLAKFPHLKSIRIGDFPMESCWAMSGIYERTHCVVGRKFTRRELLQCMVGVIASADLRLDELCYLANSPAYPHRLNHSNLLAASNPRPFACIHNIKLHLPGHYGNPANQLHDFLKHFTALQRLELTNERYSYINTMCNQLWTFGKFPDLEVIALHGIPISLELNSFLVRHAATLKQINLEYACSESSDSVEEWRQLPLTIKNNLNLDYLGIGEPICGMRFGRQKLRWDHDEGKTQSVKARLEKAVSTIRFLEIDHSEYMPDNESEQDTDWTSEDEEGSVADQNHDDDEAHSTMPLYSPTSHIDSLISSSISPSNPTTSSSNTPEGNAEA
ncbi:hypothetical protein EJ08DRAFT_663673 [Tothia fuscella]|uniref:F-box domain-containing protein n=1 Tax=Tothia fuscella TaxID=1048955 RepID=A0A9P4NL44_9PEZI|nr:hypothetical protein EJ08DRAFT_663673 [Tothia fuscella]